MNFDPTQELAEPDLKKVIRSVLSSDGVLYYSRHAEQRMMERGYNYRDISYILERGYLVSSEYNARAANWKYTIRGEDLDGDGGTVVIAIIKQCEAVIITVLSS
jgi:ribulose bisphosphate carboxylase small subunit